LIAGTSTRCGYAVSSESGLSDRSCILRLATPRFTFFVTLAQIDLVSGAFWGGYCRAYATFLDMIEGCRQVLVVR